MDFDVIATATLASLWISVKRELAIKLKNRQQKSRGTPSRTATPERGIHSAMPMSGHARMSISSI